MSQQYYGTKRIAAEPMTRLEYNNFRNWALPPDENGSDEGYLVEYLDAGKPNVEGREGYVSWSPKEQFEKAYQPIDSLTFEHAFRALKEGDSVYRKNHKDGRLFLKDGKLFIEYTEAQAKGPFEYLPSTPDLFATDWAIG